MAAEQMQCMEVWGGNRTVQQQFQMPGLDVWLYSQPYQGAEHGGDVYYLSSCASGRISRLLLADVSGHGPHVSDIALRLRDLMRRHINRISQARFVEGMNEEFAAFSQDGRFATALVGTFFAGNRSFQLCTAGHPQPLVFRQASQQWETPSPRRDGPTNLPLGIMDGVAYGQSDLKMEPGDLLLAFTDGLTEARDPSGKLLGASGLLDVVRSLEWPDPSALLPMLLEQLQETGLVTSGDDMTLLLAHANGGRTSFLQNAFAPFRLFGGVRYREA
jgi:sigma-B regulation protein RsbU (phosphoserine phosphatase)